MNIVRYLALRGRTLRGMTLVHVGAHLGEEARRYEAAGAARVVWIEADPGLFKALETRLSAIRNQPMPWSARVLGCRKTRHIAVQALVGDAENKTAEFRIFNNDGASNSIFSLHEGARDKFAGLEETGEVVRLRMRLLDRVLAEAGVPPDEVDALVVDVQGAELLCLKGAETTLAAARLLETEVSRTPVYEGGVLLDELREWLEARGFRLATRVHRDHMNAIFRRA